MRPRPPKFSYRSVSVDGLLIVAAIPALKPKPVAADKH
jgi:hypothetical protein